MLIKYVRTRITSRDIVLRLKHRTDFFSDRSRALYNRTLTVPPKISHAIVSLVEIYRRCYVSGIRIEAADGSYSVVGYQHAANEVLLSVATSGISGFHLAQDERGFRGLAVLSTSGILSNWAGDHHGVPVRRLVFDPVTAAQNSARHLKCGFDVSSSSYSNDKSAANAPFVQALKIVSLSISDGGSADCRFEGVLSLLDSTRWFPSLAGPDITVLGIGARGLWDHDSETPITLAIFGDTSESLKTVSEITARIRSYDDLMLELQVLYSRGTPPVRLGLDDVETGDVTSFTIDCEDGKYIRGVESFYEPNGVHLGFKVNVLRLDTHGESYYRQPELIQWALQVHTNKGRVGEFSYGLLDEMSRDGLHVESMFPGDKTIVDFSSRVVCPPIYFLETVSKTAVYRIEVMEYQL